MTTTDPVLLNRKYLEDFIRAVDMSGSHFFEPSTMRYFGTRRSTLELFGGVVLVGCDGKAPEGCPRYWARIFTVHPDGFIDSGKIAEGATRRTVTKAARGWVASFEWSESTKPVD